jgi:tRNA dimethylallyltransferase
LQDDLTFNLVTILGPTASGKTTLAARVANRLDAEIISADSRQVYKGMDIGTGKDLDSYIVDGNAVPFHMIDVIEPLHDFSVFDFQQHFYKAFDEIKAKGKIPFLVGGTGLYLESVLFGFKMLEVPVNQTLREEYNDKSLQEIADALKEMKPDQHNSTDTLDRERAIRALEIKIFERDHADLLNNSLPVVRSLTFGVTCDRAELRRKIRQRLKQRIDFGLIQEVEHLRESGLPWERFEYYGLEYRYVAHYLQRKINLNDMKEELAVRIGQFAKRQETWFRKMEREGLKIIWIDAHDEDLVIKKIKEGFLG